MSGFLASLPGACAQGIIWGIMAVGVYLTFKVLDLADLTVDGSFGTGGAVLVVCTIAGMNIWLAMLLAFLAGCIAGLVTGILHTKFGIPAILAGILTQLALYSVNLRIMSGRANVALNIDEYGILVSLRYIPKSILVGGAFALVIIGLLYWFFGTELGAGVRATGCNEAMARANGINTGFNKVLGLVLSNGIVALSGGLLAQYQGFADINMGRGAYRPGGRDHRRCDLWQAVQELCSAPAGSGAGRRDLLYCHSVGAANGPERQRPEAVLRFGGGAVPGRAVLERAAERQACKDE